MQSSYHHGRYYRVALSYIYRAIVVRVIDGDTAILDVDLGFYTTVRMSCRLVGINCREHDQPGGKEATAYTASLLPIGTEVVVTSVIPDKFAGRFDGHIELPDGRDVADVLVRAGFAAQWDGRGPRPVPPWPIPGGETA
jgi:micrococcal nuclease